MPSIKRGVAPKTTTEFIYKMVDAITDSELDESKAKIAKRWIDGANGAAKMIAVKAGSFQSNGMGWELDGFDVIPSGYQKPKLPGARKRNLLD